MPYISRCSSPTISHSDLILVLYARQKRYLAMAEFLDEKEGTIILETVAFLLDLIICFIEIAYHKIVSTSENTEQMNISFEQNILNS